MVKYSICKNTNVQDHDSTHSPVVRLATGKDVIWKITPNNSFFLGEHYGQHGDCSAILGGQGNNDNGFTYTGMYGVGLNGANIPSGTGAFWANELVIPDIPVTTGPPPVGYPLGSLYYVVIGGLKQVFVV